MLAKEIRERSNEELLKDIKEFVALLLAKNDTL